MSILEQHASEAYDQALAICSQSKEITKYVFPT